MTALTVDTNNKAVFADGGRREDVSSETSAASHHPRNGFGTDAKATKVKLTGKAAKRINNKLGYVENSSRSKAAG